MVINLLSNARDATEAHRDEEGAARRPDGLSLISRGRQIRPEMLAILITGHGDVEMENAAAGLVDGFLLKPIKLLELDSAIAQAVDGRNRQ